ncbi:class Ib ribonucleoside-diphosphate reductase assembly flavoprotein NrdI [Lactococcus cremoris]|nr:class Ib ribonucleoside-diphosphate reductase assembly flavoprotein NrdI [Lactococcus cremoris]KGH33617.1 hypothetical protein JL36_06100 [Lactococcus cremoris]QSE64699.1 class Ib ribonucleoside-diphosphate reductase assembly flavoprotein NrdI [Lactococcus cremoris]
MQSVSVYYISLSGNTTNFLYRLSEYTNKYHNMDIKYTNIKELIKTGETIEFDVTENYIAFLPAYLEGGNGIDSGYKEILTTPFKKFIAYGNNQFYCQGIIGSGNKNFNKQFCLTAHQYAERFDFPVLDEYELRGTDDDIKRIATKIITIFKNRKEVNNK